MLSQVYKIFSIYIIYIIYVWIFEMYIYIYVCVF